ncbi:aldo/keto reductase [Enterococcus faecium]|nr:aldo/keto reductase [Enterococcus faecium]NTP96016.1 aldo/keto reductase [Enterococcus faecium]
MNSLTSTYRLSNGYEIPVVGFGTWQTPDGDVAVSSVKEALAAGYRHIDTAQGYKNEESVGSSDIGNSYSKIPRHWSHSNGIIIDCLNDQLVKQKSLMSC